MIIAVDTCVLVDFQTGVMNIHTLFLKERLESRDVYFPPAVVTEFLSNPRFDKKTYHFFQDVPQLEIRDDYWLRAGESRRVLLQKGLKAKLGDALDGRAGTHFVGKI